MSLLAARRGSIHRPATSGGGGGFDPLNDIAWHSSFWVEDPNWTPPSDGGTTSSWRNAGSGDFGDATQSAGAASEPTYAASDANFNGQPVLYTDTPGEHLTTGTGTALSQPNTVAAVMRYFNTDNNTRVLFDSQSSGNRHAFYTDGAWKAYAGSVLSTGTTDDSTAHLVVVTFDGASSAVELDGSQIASGSAGSNTVAALSLFINFQAGQAWNGALAFLGLRDGTLTSQEKSDLLSWSQSHYGTP